MTVVGWQLQRAVTHYRTEELLLICILFYIYIHIKVLQLSDVQLISLHSASNETKLCVVI